MSTTSRNVEDITFIGSGISASFTLLHLMAAVDHQKNGPKYSITIIDKYPEFNTGIPYGGRSGFSVLLITSLRNFLPEPELSPFLTWLKANKEWLLDEFLKEGGELSKKWLDNHTAEIKKDEWEDIFIPRRFFGCYIDQKVNAQIKNLKEQGLLEVTFIASKVIDVKRKPNTWEVVLENQQRIDSKKVVLAIGSLPTGALWKDDLIIENETLLFINNPYKPELQDTLNRISSFLEKQPMEYCDVAIVGANASGLEMLYKMNDYPRIASRTGRFTILSTQGLMPDSIVDREKLSRYTPQNLKALAKKPSLTAEEIAVATFQDLESAEKMELGAASTVGIISSAFGSLLGKLDAKGLKTFACEYGNEIGRRQRVAGVHYSETVEGLKKEGRFEHIAGRFSDINEANGSYQLEYLDTATRQNKIIENPVQIVINCIGGMNLSTEGIPRLLRNLIDNGHIKANASKIGIEVNNDLEASTNFHVVGPMLAGNVIDNHAIWHVEHCGRIVALSKILAQKLIVPKNAKNFRLNVIDFENPEAEVTCTELVANTWEDNPYYTPEYFQHHVNAKNGLIFFEMKSKTASLAVMPMVKRKIANSDYFDVISPYGYSGPLFKKNVEPEVQLIFWELVDQWYRDNNIITEFVRFSLNGNFKNYSGECHPTLNNISGKLLKNFEEQWASFLTKVRNNYRKAKTFDLGIKIFEHKNITKKAIADFYEIYVATMKRNNAQDYLYFSLRYFEKLISRHPKSFVLGMVYYQNKPISTELIISQKDYIHAFLGGTLAENFAQRPNDFLRVEVIRWAIGKGKEKYILGGGVKNDDGLYKSKKALFPKDPDLTFYTGRKVICETKYAELNSQLGLGDNADKNELFFPLYRKIN